MGGNDGEAQRRPLPRILTADLRSRHVEPLTGPIEQRADHLASVLEGVGVGDPNLHLEADHVHDATVLSTRMRGVEVSERHEDFTADPVASFFDLVAIAIAIATSLVAGR